MEHTINFRMKKVRELLEMTQISFAKNLGITSAHVSKIEKGKTTPSEALIKLICKEYDINEYWLKFGQGDIFNDEPDEDEVFDSVMSTSTSNLNRLLRSKNDKIRILASELNLLFSEIISIDNIEDEQYKIKYLEDTKAMFLMFNEASNNIKKYVTTNEIFLDSIVEHIKETYKNNMIKAIDNFFE